MRLGPSIGIPGDAASAGGFSPAQLNGLVLWLRADLGITLNGGTVQAWADQSGQGNNVTQAAAPQQPTFVASDPNLAGKPSLTFSAAATSALDNTTKEPVAQSGARTIFAVIRGTDTVGGTIIDDNRSGVQDFAFQLFQSAGTTYAFSDAFTTNVSYTVGPTILNTAYYVTYVDSGTGVALVTRLNGVVTANNAATMPAETAGLGFTVGSRAGFGQSWTGAIGEVIELNVAASAGVISQVEAYLKGRYNL